MSFTSCSDLIFNKIFMESNVFLYAEILKVHSYRLMQSNEAFAIPIQIVLKIRLSVSSDVMSLLICTNKPSL